MVSSHLALNVWLFGIHYSALGGSDEWIYEGDSIRSSPCFAILIFFFLFVLCFESPAYYRRWGFNGRFEVS